MSVADATVMTMNARTPLPMMKVTAVNAMNRTRVRIERKFRYPNSSASTTLASR
jgi:hypothetical protein